MSRRGSSAVQASRRSSVPAEGKSQQQQKGASVDTAAVVPTAATTRPGTAAARGKPPRAASAMGSRNGGSGGPLSTAAAEGGDSSRSPLSGRNRPGTATATAGGQGIASLRETIDAIRSGNDPLSSRPRSASPGMMAQLNRVGGGAMSRPSTAMSMLSKATTPSSRPLTGAGGEIFDGPGGSHLVTHRKRKPLYVGDRLGGEACLPRPISAGLRFAADMSTFSELAERDILAIPDDEKTRLKEEDVETIYVAKCLDQRCPRTFDRMNRFFSLIGDQCKGQFFSLRQCGIGANAADAIAKVLANDAHYTQLDLSGNNIGLEGGQAIGQLLRSNQTLCVLRLQSANLGEGGVYSIVDALHKNTHLTALDFGGISGIHRNNIWGRAAKALGYMLQVNTVLSYLNLSCCGIQRTASFILQSCVTHKALNHLDISGNGIKDDCAASLAKLLSDSEPSAPELNVLNLDRNLFTDEGITKIVAALNTDGTAANSLQTLSLVGNKFGVAGTIAIGDALANHPSIQTLNISYNTVQKAGVDEDGYRLPDSADGIRHLFTCLKSNQKLETFKMSECDIEIIPSNVESFLEATTSIKHLDLSHNRFKDEGAELIAHGLAQNKTLVSLNLQTCGLSNKGGEVLGPALEHHPELRFLKIHNTSLSIKNSGLLLALKSNTMLRSVDGGKDCVAELAPALERNKKLSIVRAGPELAKVQATLEEEKDGLNRTLDLIAEEKRRREKLYEMIKTTRERHKAAATLLKNEIEDLQQDVDRMSHVQRQLENQLNSAEDATTNQKMKLQSEASRITRKIEAQQRFTSEAQVQVVNMKKELAKVMEDPEIAALEKELAGVEAEVNERKAMYKMIEKRMNDAEEASKMSASIKDASPKGKKRPASGKGKSGKRPASGKKKK